MAAISIIVPIYNVEKYVGKCLESLRSQTFSDIEIVCIDDASTDGSLEIVKQLVSQDQRIRLVSHTENMGTLKARKHGVELSTGEYIIFLDSDDWLEVSACEKLYSRIEEEQVDILQFGTNVIPAVPVSEDMIQWVENFLKPYEKRVNGKDILRQCIVDNCFDFNITDKIWRGDLCRKAFSAIEDQRMVAAEDQYAFFILGFYAKSYLGIADAKYYNYNIGIGITGSDSLDLERFEKRCTGALAAQAVEHFLQIRGELEAYRLELVQFEHNILWDCVDCWHNKLKKYDYGKGYDILLKYWDASNVLSAIARVYFEQEEDITSRTRDSEVLNKNSAVGIYYRYMGYEPMKPYIKSQIDVIQKNGQKVILFADSDAEDYNMQEWGVGITLLPPSKDANWNQYETRSKAFCKQIKKHQIGSIFYASPTSHIAWLDALLIKSMGVSLFYMNEGKEILRIREEKTLLKLEEETVNMLGMQKEANEKYIRLLRNYDQVINSKTYKIGTAIMWLPKKIKQIFSIKR